MKHPEYLLQAPPCEVCGRHVEDCTCDPCPICGVTGNPSCPTHPVYRYYFTSRPPGIGTHPAGETSRKTFDGRKKFLQLQVDLKGTQVEQHGWGWVEYPEPLSLNQLWKWDLIPHLENDFNRFLAYTFWKNCDSNTEWAGDLAKEYFELSPEDLAGPHLRRDFLAKLITYGRETGKLEASKIGDIFAYEHFLEYPPF